MEEDRLGEELVYTSKNKIVAKLVGKWQESLSEEYNNPETGFSFSYPSIFGDSYYYDSKYMAPQTGGDMDKLMFQVYDDVKEEEVNPNSSLTESNNFQCELSSELKLSATADKFYTGGAATCGDLFLFKNKKDTYSGLRVTISRFYTSGDSADMGDTKAAAVEDRESYVAIMQEILDTVSID